MHLPNLLFFIQVCAKGAAEWGILALGKTAPEPTAVGLKIPSKMCPPLLFPLMEKCGSLALAKETWVKMWFHLEHAAPRENMRGDDNNSITSTGCAPLCSHGGR